MTRESFDLSRNESPFGPLPSVAEAVGRATRRISRYPDAGTLTAALTDRLGVPAAHVLVGCGSAALAQDVLGAVGGPDGEVVFAWPSFEAYPHLASRAAMKSIRVPLRDGAHDLTAMAEAITDRTRAVLVCNPNNPTGTVVRRGPLAEFLDAVPSDCPVVLDEAYGEYVRDREVPDGLSFYRDRPNVAVLRTFSKAYGLAGLRVGYLVAHPHLADAVRGFMLPFTVNSLGSAAAVASLEATAELEHRVTLVLGERERIRCALLELGWTVPASEANFLWLPLGERTSAFVAHCARAGAVIGAYPPLGVRVTVGTAEANDAFLRAALSFPDRP